MTEICYYCIVKFTSQSNNNNNNNNNTIYNAKILFFKEYHTISVTFFIYVWLIEWLLHYCQERPFALSC